MLSIRVSPLALTGGLAIGVGTSAIFVVLLGAIAARTAFPHVIAPEWVIALLVVALALMSAVAYALLVARARGEPILWSRELRVAALLPLVGAGGLVFAAQFEALGTSRADLTLPVFRLAFVSASFMVAFVCTVAAAGFYSAPRALRSALAVATVTGATYLVCAIVLDVLPGFHVGGGDRAMPKVAALSNLCAGLVGGYLAFVVLTRRGNLNCTSQPDDSQPDQSPIILSQ